METHATELPAHIYFCNCWVSVAIFCTLCLSNQWRSVTLHGLPLRRWVSMTSKAFHFAIIPLIPWRENLLNFIHLWQEDWKHLISKIKVLPNIFIWAVYCTVHIHIRPKTNTETKQFYPNLVSRTPPTTIPSQNKGLYVPILYIYNYDQCSLFHVFQHICPIQLPLKLLLHWRTAASASGWHAGSRLIDFCIRFACRAANSCFTQQVD